MSQPSYYQLHHRLRKVRGRASDQPCRSCGTQAADWAYDKSDPDPLTERTYNGRDVTYSADLERYVPLCKACHYALDNPPRTHCKRGHAYTPSNTYTRPNGRYFCRTQGASK